MGPHHAISSFKEYVGKQPSKRMEGERAFCPVPRVLDASEATTFHSVSVVSAQPLLLGGTQC